jgi:hypothetical protein
MLYTAQDVTKKYYTCLPGVSKEDMLGQTEQEISF